MKRAAWLCLLWSAASAAHPLAPALLELHETGPAQYSLLWRTSVARVQRTDVEPRLPAGCTASGEQTAIEEGEAFVMRSRVRCTGPLEGERLAVAGLERSGINVIVRIERRDGRVSTEVLDPAHPSFVVPPASAAPSTFGRYFGLGVEHLLTGLDHVLFVLGLVVLVRRLARLAATVTAFTLGHSVTLGLATLGLVHFSQAAAELGIALSILALACRIAAQHEESGVEIGVRPRLKTWSDPDFWRWPWVVAGAFGLLHGLGFAGALAGVGLPQAEIPLALLAFNLGIEAGQLLIVAAALAAGALWARRLLPASITLSLRLAPGYVIGSLAACWCLERTLMLAVG